MEEKKSEDWQQSNLQVFWGEIAPCEHVVQIYDNDNVFLNGLEGFAGSGLIAGDTIIVIATSPHLEALENRLYKQGFDINSLSSANRYITLDAKEALSAFMVNNWPDDALFSEFIAGLLSRAQKNNNKVRAFGEMVALLWEEGLNGATVHLESLWNKFQEDNKFTLFCAYPRIGITQDIGTSINTICSCHSKIINGAAKPSTEIYYRTAG